MPGYHSAIPAVEWASASVLPVTQVSVMSAVTSVSALRPRLMLSAGAALRLHASSTNVMGSPRLILHFVLGPRNLPEGLPSFSYNGSPGSHRANLGFQCSSGSSLPATRG